MDGWERKGGENAQRTPKAPLDAADCQAIEDRSNETGRPAWSRADDRSCRCTKATPDGRYECTFHPLR